MSVKNMLMGIAGALGSKWERLTLNDATAVSLGTGFTNQNWQDCAIKKLSANSVVIVYAYYNNSGVGALNAVIASVDADYNVTLGSPLSLGSTYYDTSNYNSIYMFMHSLTVLSLTSFVFGWTDGNGNGKCCACTVSGTTITKGTTVNIQTTSNVLMRYINAIALSSTEVMFVYRNYSNNYMVASLHSVSGTTMTYRSNVTLSTSIFYSINIQVLDAYRILVSLGSGGSTGAFCTVVYFSGSTIAKGANYTIPTVGGWQNWISDITTIKLSLTSYVFIGVSTEVAKAETFMVPITVDGSTTVTFGTRFSVTTQYNNLSTTDDIAPAYWGYPIILEQSGNITYYMQLFYTGTETTSSRPAAFIFKLIGTSTLVFIRSVNLFSSTTLYTRFNAAGSAPFLGDLVTKDFVGCVVVTKDGATYDIKFLKIVKKG